MSRGQLRNSHGTRTSPCPAQQEGLRGPSTQVISLLVGLSFVASMAQVPREETRYKYFLVLLIYLLSECHPNEEVVFLRAGPGLSGLLMSHQFQEEGIVFPPYTTSTPTVEPGVGLGLLSLGPMSSWILGGPVSCPLLPLTPCHVLVILTQCSCQAGPVCLPGVDSGASGPGPCWLHRLSARSGARSQCQAPGRD